LIALALVALGGIGVTRVLTMERQAPAAPSSVPPSASTADLGAVDVEGTGRAQPIGGATADMASDTTATPVTATVTATTARTMADEVDAGLRMPEGWPALLALYPNAVLIGASAAAGGLVQAITTDDPAAVLAFYRGRFSGRKTVDNKVNMLMVNTGEGLGIVQVDARESKPRRSMVTLSFQKLKKR